MSMNHLQPEEQQMKKRELENVIQGAL